MFNKGKGNDALTIAIKKKGGTKEIISIKPITCNMEIRFSEV